MTSPFTCTGAAEPRKSDDAMNARAENAAAIDRELAWLSQLVDASIRLHFGQECACDDVRNIAPPDLTPSTSAYAQLINDSAMSFEERVVFILALVPRLRPQLLDPFLMKNPNFERGFTEFGGVLSGNLGGFWPTVETAAFVLCGENLERRFALQSLLEPDRLLVLSWLAG